MEKSELLLLAVYFLGLAQGAWFAWWWIRGRRLLLLPPAPPAHGDEEERRLCRRAARIVAEWDDP